jgi:hypothetical protein
MLRASAIALLLAAAPPVPPTQSAPPPAARAERPVLAGFDAPSGERFSGRFTDAPLDAVLRKVAESAGLSIVLPPGLRGAVTADFRDAPVEDVLRVLLSQHDLSATKDGGILDVRRAGRPSLVVRGGKRSLEFDLPDLDVDLDAGPVEPVEPGPADGAGGGRGAADAEEPRARAADRVLSGDQVIGAGQRVGSLVVLRGSVRLEAGASAEEVVAVLGSAEIGPGAAVRGNVVSVGGDVRVAAGGSVDGEAVSVGGLVVIDEGGTVAGEQVSVQVPGVAGALSLLGTRPLLGLRESPLLGAGRAVALFAVLFVLGLLLVTVAPRRVERVGATMQNAPVHAMFTGLLGTIALPVLTLLLIVTLIGIPLVAVQVLAVVLAWLLGLTGLALLIGRAIPLRLERRLTTVQLALGTAAIVLATRLPLLGTMVWIAAWLFAFGAVLRSRFGQAPSAAETPLPTSPVGGPPPL